jgi:hypothetical protein
MFVLPTQTRLRASVKRPEPFASDLPRRAFRSAGSFGKFSVAGRRPACTAMPVLSDRSSGARLYLPPCTRDMDPIEQLFAQA